MKLFFGKFADVFRGKKKGFTLIELLVVIAIIGVLASIVLASLNSARRKARDARRIADIKELQLALELYFDSNDAYAPALIDLTGNNCGGAPCIVAVPVDPSGTTHEYRYCRFGSNLRYHIGASLEESGNNALDNDSNAADPCGNGAISGVDTGACGDALVTTRYCYNLGM